MTDEQLNALSIVVNDMKRIAQYGHYDGWARNPQMQRYMSRCRRIIPGGILLFTRDRGMHSSGWWKNPDYGQCLHLSVSFFDQETGQPAPHDHKAADQLARLFFGDYIRLLWIEAPFSPEGKAHDVWHYRLFTTPDFKTPLLPRGEVYTRDFTEAGWRSWSDVHAEPQETRHT